MISVGSEVQVLPGPPSGVGADNHRGDIAQLVEHLLCKQGVTGSNPVVSIITGSPSANVLAKRVRGDNPPEGAKPVRRRRTQHRSQGSPGVKPHCFAERSRVRVDCFVTGTRATLVVIQPTIFALCQGESGSGASLDTCDRIGARWSLSVLSDDRPLKTDN